MKIVIDSLAAEFHILYIFGAENVIFNGDKKCALAHVNRDVGAQLQRSCEIASHTDVQCVAWMKGVNPIQRLLERGGVVGHAIGADAEVGGMPALGLGGKDEVEDNEG